MRLLLSACVALFFCLPARAQTCTTPETVLQMWNAQASGIQVISFEGADAQKILSTYNKIEPVSDHKADKIYAASSQAVQGVGIIFAMNGCVVVTDASSMEAFKQLLQIALGKGA